ncbi:hypothetical protein [Streptomyces fumanus]|uniref:Uncharacterized protein n=1 Tax=Streptomyces fumanus TaxID=67302 RepID=A0A919A8F9_9ACTN|nr:hypothetical protein [Streptomyces fumanus]GHE91178.1 hypothetical protein GCM10018772_13980 [Streptomyces fumanus]
MSPVRPVVRAPRRCVWPRVLVLLLALLLPVVHAGQAQPVASVAAAGESGGGGTGGSGGGGGTALAEYDVLDAVARTPVRRAALPRRPAPRTGVAVPSAAGRPPVPPSPPPYAPCVPRSVVLRC